MATYPVDTATKVSFVDTFAQPDNAHLKAVSIQQRPSVIIAGSHDSLHAVRVVHSPTSPSSPSSPRSFLAQTATSPRVGPWTRKVFRSGWTGPADVVLTLTMLIVSMCCYGMFLRWHENRTDIAAYAVLHDPVLPLFSAIDCSIPLSVLVYGAVSAGFVYSCTKPDVMMELMQTHVGVMWIRMLALYVTPLEAPAGTIPLVDTIAHPDGAVLVRDLFFSGHTAATCTLFLGTRRCDRKWKAFFGVLMAITAALVVVQKAHYVIDVVAAPCFVHTTRSLVMEARRVAGMLLAPPPSSSKMPFLKPKRA